MNKIALGRDAYFQTHEGKSNLDGSSIGLPSGMAEYLKNRLEMAFLAGYNCAERVIYEDFSQKIKSAIKQASE